MKIKILHTADWHIGTFNGPEIDGENGRYLELCKTLDELCEAAEQERPDYILFSGDMFHAAKTWSDRGLKENQKAVEIIRRLAEISSVVILRGTPNHDSDQQFNSLKSTFKTDRRVTIITEPSTKVIVQDTPEKAIRIAAIPGFDKGYFRAKNPGLSSEEENAVFTQAIKDLIVGMNAEKVDMPTVLMAHYTVVGCNMESGQTALFEKYEPVIYPADLQTAAYDLACLGHIHRPQEVVNCDNVYYSGAISQLNFNDEEQKRGYYIHNIDSETHHVESEFKALPSKQFSTLHFGDGDIARFIESGDTLILKDFKDRIVRVLYSCTDEHNKVFSKVEFEKMLYKKGAYYVQEITPENILITANKESLNRDSSPEENLVAYLDEKGTPAEKISYLVEIARPIIAEATATENTNHNAGMFVPKEICVHNYRNYRDETFDFSGINFCTINGNNGVGKSSLFMDAILDALFEEPREGELTGWISNDEAARSGSIQFTFGLGEKIYRVTRTRAKSGKATLNLSEYVEGEWENRSKEKYRDTQAIIAETLGMDSLTIKACALIMQDQYGLFLQADKEARMNVLGNILGLKAYEVMEQLASEKATEVNREIRNANDKISEKTNGADSIEELGEERETLNNGKAITKAKLEQARETAQTISAMISEQMSAAARIVKTQGKIQTIDSTVAEKESAKANQQVVIYSADKILAERETIKEMTADYDTLVAAEKALIEKQAVYKSTQERLRQVEYERQTLGTSIADLKGRLDDSEKDIELLETLAEKEPELIKAHQEYLELQSELKSQQDLKAEFQQRKAAYEAACKYEEQAKSLFATEKDKWRDKIAETERKIGLLTNDCGCLDLEKASCKFLRDALESKKKLPEYTAKIAEIERQEAEKLKDLEKIRLEALQALNEKTYDPERELSLNSTLSSPDVQQREKDYGQIENVKVKLDAAKDKLAQLAQTLSEKQEKKTALESEGKTLETKLASTAFDESEYRAVKSKISCAKMWLDKAKEIPLAEERKRTATERIAEIESQISSLTDEKVELLVEIEKDKQLAEGYESRKELLEKQKAEISTLETELSEIEKSIGAVETKIESAKATEQEVSRLRQRLAEHETTAAGYEILKTAFSQEGIPHNIVRSVIPALEATATNILGQMSGGKMSVEIVTEKTLKSNSKKEVTALDVVINDVNTGRLPYLSRSGGERVKAALSVILALSEIKSTKAGIQLGFLFIDEPPFLDAEGVQAYCDALEAIQKRYSSLKVMAITHDPSMKARFPQSVDVIKTDAGSKVI